MSSLENLSKRLNYRGGKDQQERMWQDKLRTLRKALIYSDQAATIELQDGRYFRCLINPDKLTGDYDNKIISIPYDDVCLNSNRTGTTTEGIEPIGLKPGDTFLWIKTNSHWLVYLEALDEAPYFIADIRRCDQEIEVNKQKYWVYIRGPVETTIPWMQKAQTAWNDLNYSLVMYITKDENTESFFHRFQQLKIKNKNWKIVNCNSYFGDGILEVYLDEDFNNKILDAAIEEKNNEPESEPIDPNIPQIKGPIEVTCYSKHTYEVVGRQGGKWLIFYNGKEQDLKKSAQKVDISVNIGKPGHFTLIYRVDGQEDLTLLVKIAAAVR